MVIYFPWFRTDQITSLLHPCLTARGYRERFSDEDFIRAVRHFASLSPGGETVILWISMFADVLGAGTVPSDWPRNFSEIHGQLGGDSREVQI